jgi:hypothetical protein
MEHTEQSLKLRRLIGDLKKRREELDARRETLALEQQRIDLERKLLDEDSNDVKERIKAIIDTADYIPDALEAAPECFLDDSILDKGKRFETDIGLIKAIIAPAEAVQQQNRAVGRAAGKLVRYGDMPQKKQIKTLLHIILELTNKRGKIKLKDIAKEIEVDESTLKQWVNVMDRRGMVRATYSIRGEVFVEKASYQANPQL